MAFQDDKSDNATVPQKVQLIVDMINSRTSAMGQADVDPAMISPEKIAKNIYGSEKKKTAEKDKPVASINVPNRRLTNIGQGLRNFQLSSQKFLPTNSGLKKHIDQSQHVPFRTKKNILHPKVTAIKSCQNEYKNGGKDGNNTASKSRAVRHFVSA